MSRFATLVVTMALLAVAAGCKTVPVDQRAAAREEALRSSEETKGLFVRDDPDLERELAAAAGYFTARISGGKVLVGGANGIGVLVDNASQSRTFMNATRVDVGVALGAGTERILVILETREALEQFRRGMRKFGFGAKAGVGEAGAKAHSFSEQGYKFLGSSETGAGVTATAGMLSFSVNIDLTDAGVSDVSVPSTGFKAADKQRDDAPRVWNYKLPFLAQKVIDKGYDLPLPYGAGLIFSVNEQEQTITGLEVGINGRDKAPFSFVSFDQTITKTDSLNAKVDAWLFPFMNVYATFGPFKGDAALDILIDGDGMLEHMGISCGGFIRPDLCDSLEGQTVLLPIHTTPSGTNWGVGGVLAGGWKGWFVTIPFNFSRVDLGPTFADGGPIITVTPRFGRNFSLGDLGNFALFAGGNYLESKLEISGTYRIPVGGEELTFDYTVQQKNKDAWNLLFGFNWDLNKQFSWNMEYDGFIGTRDAFIASITWRF
jgi:lipid-binding SYLF domain-containing protein